MKKFGETKDGHAVSLYTLKSDDVEVGLINYGATIVFLKTKDKDGNLDDIITGFEDMDGKPFVLLYLCISS